MLGTFNGAPGFMVTQQGTGWYTPHIFTDEAHFRAWVRRTQPGNIVRPADAHGRCVHGVDHRFNSEETERKGTDMDTNQSQAQSQAARTATPAPAKSPLKSDDNKRLDLMARLVSASEAQLQLLREMRDTLGIISTKLDLILDRAESQPAAAPAANGNGGEAAPGNYTDYDAEAITVGTDDNGKPVYKVKGGQFGKFGVRVWPEVLPLLSVEVANLKPGPNQFNARVRALLDDTGAAKKVVGLAK